MPQSLNPLTAIAQRVNQAAGTLAPASTPPPATATPTPPPDQATYQRLLAAVLAAMPHPAAPKLFQPAYLPNNAPLSGQTDRQAAAMAPIGIEPSIYQHPNTWIPNWLLAQKGK